VRYELGFYIPEDAIFHSHRRENLKSYTILKHQFHKISANSLAAEPLSVSRGGLDCLLLVRQLISCLGANAPGLFAGCIPPFRVVSDRPTSGPHQPARVVVLPVAHRFVAVMNEYRD
jgi:hypothetical protein